MKAVQSRGELFVDVGCDDQLPRLDSCWFFWSSLDSELHGGHLMLSPALVLANVVCKSPRSGKVFAAWEVGDGLSLPRTRLETGATACTH